MGDARDERPKLAKTFARPRERRPVVLVADDDASTRTALRMLLTGEGYEVTEAVDGAQTLEMLARAADGRGTLPDVVLLDFVMPGLSGLGVLRVMRRFARMPPTIVMTGFRDPSVATFAHSLGAVRVLRKPIDEGELFAVLLESARGTREKRTHRA